MKRIAALLALSGLTAQPALAFEPFTISDIRVEGLERISAGAIYTNLPVEKGDRVDNARAAEAVRALFKTGFFNDVNLSRQGDILVIKVAERPAISKITLTGNKDIKEEQLRAGLKDIGLSEGETFDRLQLERLTQELTRQYNNRGKYNVSIKPKVNELDRNRVDLDIVIAEGKAAKINHINIVGNKAFDEKEIREAFESDTTNWLSWYSRNDQYSREKLTSDIEKLISFYQDRGYVDFDVESTQVTISPDRRDIFLTLNVREGEVFALREIKLTGDLILPEAELQKLVQVKNGDTFSRRKLEQTAEAITKILANIGYAFAEVTPYPELDKEKRLVDVRFLVSPGKRVSVRRIEFKGNTQTLDEVLRREMRQLEGAWFSQAAIDRSKIRLQRLGYFKNINIETPKVDGSEDQVDLKVSVEETSSGAFQFGLGYSQLQGLLTSISVQQRNFLGTGNTVGVQVQNNDFQKRFDFNYFDPYINDNGLSLGYNLFYREVDQGQQNIARFTTDTFGGEVLMGLPISETDTVSFNFGIDDNDLSTVDGSTPNSLIQYLVDELGDRVRQPVLGHTDNDQNPATPINNDDDTDQNTFDVPVLVPGSVRTWNINSWHASAGWARDTRNKFFAPTRGTYHRVGVEVALPGSDLEFYKLNYQFEHYFQLSPYLVALVGANIGYGDAYGSTSKLPFFENFYAGGPSSMRGFKENTLGPFESIGIVPGPGNENAPGFRQPLGGAFKTIGTVELLFPQLLKKAQDSMQFSAFLDIGNVFEDVDAFEANELRASAGLSMKWLAPVGAITINLAQPIRKKDGDETETLQFTFGNSF